MSTVMSTSSSTTHQTVEQLSTYCFYSSSSSNTAYSNWKLQWTTTPSSGYNGMGGTRSGLNNLHQSDDGYLSISAQHGPQMNLLFYDSSMNDWAMVGIGDSTPEIETGTRWWNCSNSLDTYKMYSWSSITTGIPCPSQWSRHQRHIW